MSLEKCIVNSNTEDWNSIHVECTVAAWEENKYNKSRTEILIKIAIKVKNA